MIITVVYLHVRVQTKCYYVISLQTAGEVDFSPSAATPDAVDAPSIVTQFSVANNTAILPVSKTIQVTSIVTNVSCMTSIKILTSVRTAFELSC